jgi:hypothetical protein
MRAYDDSDRLRVVILECAEEVFVGGVCGNAKDEGGVAGAARAGSADEQAASVDDEVFMAVDRSLEAIVGLEIDEAEAQRQFLRAIELGDDPGARDGPKLRKCIAQTLPICLVIDVAHVDGEFRTGH